jgi:hypothetical protein
MMAQTRRELLLPALALASAAHAMNATALASRLRCLALTQALAGPLPPLRGRSGLWRQVPDEPRSARALTATAMSLSALTTHPPKACWPLL